MTGRGLSFKESRGSAYCPNQLLFDDDKALVVESGKKLSQLLQEFG